MCVSHAVNSTSGVGEVDFETLFDEVEGQSFSFAAHDEFFGVEQVAVEQEDDFLFGFVGLFVVGTVGTLVEAVEVQDVTIFSLDLVFVDLVAVLLDYSFLKLRKFFFLIYVLSFYIFGVAFES